jgi:hypothetical protein
MVWTPHEAVKTELQPGETVRWIGAPSFTAMLGTQLFQIIFAIAWTSVCFPFLLGALNEPFFERVGWNSISLIGSILGIGFGLWMLGNGVWNSLAAWRTAYAVTDRRILVVSDLGWRHVLTVVPGAINTIERSERSNGRGSITFRRETVDTSDGPTTTTMSFVGVRDVRNAAREIENLRRGNK